MKIAMLMPNLCFPDEVRAESEIRALLAGGHQVAVLAGWTPGQPLSEQVGEVAVERIRMSLLAVKATNLLMKMAGYRWHPVWGRRMARFVREHDPQALHVQGIQPVPVACRVARRTSIPVVLDLREDYPEQAGAARKRLSGRLFNSVRKLDRVQRRCCERADGVLVVTERFGEAMAQRYPAVPPGRFSVFSNMADLERLREMVPVVEDTSDPSGFDLFFVGTMGTRERGVQVAVDAMPAILSEEPRARMVLAGYGGYVPVLEQQVERLGVSDAVRFTGQLPFADVLPLIGSSHACFLCDLRESQQTDLGIPLKLFQYMYMKKPVVVSDITEVEKVVSASGAGLCFEPGNPADFARCVLKLRDPALRREMGGKGHAAVVERYNLREDSARLLQLYDALSR